VFSVVKVSYFSFVYTAKFLFRGYLSSQTVQYASRVASDVLQLHPTEQIKDSMGENVLVLFSSLVN